MAMAAYVVSDVTTFTGAAGAPGRAGDGPTTPSKRAMIDSMSVGLVFMRSNGPDRLKGDLMVRRSIGDSLPLILSAKENPLALPQRERGDELSRDHPEIRGLDVVVTSTKDEALVQLVGRADVAAEARRPGAGNLFLQREQLAAQRPFVVHRAQRRAPRQPELEPADLRAQRRVRIGAIQRRAADLHIRRMIELPEVEQVQQIGRSAAVAEQLRVARAPGHLRGELVSSQPTKRAIERKPRPGETVLSEEGRDREWILRFGHGMEMPAIELAELLPVLAEIESHMAGQPGPVGVAFLDTDMAALEADEDLGVRVGVEGGLKADLELSRIEVIALHASARGVRAHIARSANLGVQLRLIALPTDRLCQRIRGPRRVAQAAARGLTGGRAQRGEVVTDRRREHRGGGRAAPEDGEHAVQSGAQLSHLCRQRIHLSLRRLLAGAGHRQTHRRQQYGAHRAYHVG